MKAKDILAALAAYHPLERDWIFLPELRIGTGFGKDADGRIDAWAMHCHASKNLRRISYEIKVSRPDFVAEIRKPSKRKHALLFSNEYYFATPVGLIRPEELPPEAGLIEIHANIIDALQAHHPTWGFEAIERLSTRITAKSLETQLYVIRVPAPWRDTPPPSWRFFASTVRRALRDKK